MSSVGLFSSLTIASSSRLSSSLRCLFSRFSSRFSCFSRSFSCGNIKDDMTTLVLWPNGQTHWKERWEERRKREWWNDKSSCITHLSFLPGLDRLHQHHMLPMSLPLLQQQTSDIRDRTEGRKETKLHRKEHTRGEHTSKLQTRNYTNKYKNIKIKPYESKNKQWKK